MIVVFPMLAASVTWITSPEPQYESKWTVNIYFDDPARVNSPTYFDFIFLDDLHLLINTGLLGDIMYLNLPEDIAASISRSEFGSMVQSSRKANFVEIVVSGDDPEVVRAVADTIDSNLADVANQYLVPPTYTGGAATVNVMDPITEPSLNTRPRLVRVGSVAVGTLLGSIAATGVAEWLRISYRAKYSAR